MVAAFTDQSLGSQLWTWGQTGGNVKMMDEDQSNAGVNIWVHYYITYLFIISRRKLSGLLKFDT